jgi:hypothetical protein
MRGGFSNLAQRAGKGAGVYFSPRFRRAVPGRFCLYQEKNSSIKNFVEADVFVSLPLNIFFLIEGGVFPLALSKGGAFFGNF